MDTSKIIGNENLKRELEKPFHAYIIEGSHGSGKTTLANLIAQASICISEGLRPCGKCPSCVKFLADCNIDIKRIPADTDVKNMRLAISDIYVRPNESEKRCYIIEDCDVLSVACQNVLLKSLEEPPEFSVFIMTCTSKEKLLETIRSRCVVLTLSPVRNEDASKFFERKEFSKYTSQQKQAAISLSEGFLGKAVEILEGNSYDIYNICESFTNACLDGAAGEAMKLSSFKTREELRDFVRTLSVYISARIRSGTDKRDVGRLFALESAVETLVNDVEYNINVKLWNVVLVMRCLRAVSVRRGI
ncbi:MAG: AAA family ATPase [Clostridia bacterium]|nr:AAA family ATPase [Clostridia bacterium]